MLSTAPELALVAAPCLEYGVVVSLSGTLVRQTYPGPPDYESVASGDEPRVIWVLLLERRICAVDPNPGYPGEYYQREVQLALEADRYVHYRNLLGKRVTATGKLLHGAAQYEKRLVLRAVDIARTGAPP